MIATVGSSKGIDEYGRTVGTEVPMVAIGSIVTATNLRCISVAFVDTLENIHIGGSRAVIGINHHQSFISTTEKVDIDQQFHSTEGYKRVIGKIMGAHQA